MTAPPFHPHELPPPPGPSAELAATLRSLVPEIATARTRLRAPHLGDFPAWTAILCSERAVFMDGPYDRHEACEEFCSYVGSWLLRGFGAWTVVARQRDTALGFVHLGFEPGDHEPELGWFVLPEAEGRGLAFEAAAAARDWARAQGMASLVSYTDPLNRRSIRLAERLGARRDAAAEARFAGTPDAGVAVYRHWGTAP